MRTRVQFVVDPIAKGRYWRAALARGMTLSEWARRTLDAAATDAPEEETLRSRPALTSFFAAVNRYEERVSHPSKPRRGSPRDGDRDADAP